MLPNSNQRIPVGGKAAMLVFFAGAKPRLGRVRFQSNSFPAASQGHRSAVTFCKRFIVGCTGFSTSHSWDSMLLAFVLPG
jgi:hypothetical protein